MKVAYLSYDGLTDPLGQSQILPYVKGLSRKHGHRFWVLSHEKKARMPAHGSAVRSALEGIEWLPLSYHKHPPVLSTVWDVVCQWRAAADLHRRVGIDLFHCRSYLSALVGLAMKRRYQTGFLFDMRGFWADERVDGGLWNRKNPLYDLVYRFFKFKEREFLQEADAVISLTRAAGDEMLNWGISGLAEKTTVIPCCCDLEHFSPDSVVPSGLAEALGLWEQNYVLAYLGSIGTWYLLDEMLLFFRHLQQQRPQARFLFITPERPNTIFSRARELGVAAEAIRVREATRAEVPLLLGLADAGIYFIKPCYSKISSCPTKLAEMLAMGLPVVTNSGVGDPLPEEVGPQLAEFSASEFDRGVTALLRLKPTKRRELALRHFSLDTGVECYAEVYHQLEKKIRTE